MLALKHMTSRKIQCGKQILVHHEPIACVADSLKYWDKLSRKLCIPSLLVCDIAADERSKLRGHRRFGYTQSKNTDVPLYEWLSCGTSNCLENSVYHKFRLKLGNDEICG